MYQRLRLISAALKAAPPRISSTYWFSLVFFFKIWHLLSISHGGHGAVSPLCYPLLAADSGSCQGCPPFPRGSGTFSTHGIVSCRRTSSSSLPRLTGGWRSQMVACSVRLPPSACSHKCHPELNMSHTKRQCVHGVKPYAENDIHCLCPKVNSGVYYENDPQWSSSDRERERAENVGHISLLCYHESQTSRFWQTYAWVRSEAAHVESWLLHICAVSEINHTSLLRRDAAEPSPQQYKALSVISFLNQNKFLIVWLSLAAHLQISITTIGRFSRIIIEFDIRKLLF